VPSQRLAQRLLEVSDGYSISGNIVPDLSFCLFGVRRVGHPEYLEMHRQYWRLLATQVNAEGRLTSQRVMGQVFFPLGMEGKTVMFHQWYAVALKRIAALHEEFVRGRPETRTA